MAGKRREGKRRFSLFSVFIAPKFAFLLGLTKTKLFRYFPLSHEILSVSFLLVWYFETDGDIEDFFAEVESIDEFRIPLKYKPLGLNVYQEEV
jgi:hypothetical protein